MGLTSKKSAEKLRPSWSTAIVEARRRKGLSQQRLADLVGMTQSKIADLETGRIRPQILALRKIDAFLNSNLVQVLIDDSPLVVNNEGSVRWQVIECIASDRGALDVLLKDSWEPFAVDNGVLWLKRKS